MRRATAAIRHWECMFLFLSVENARPAVVLKTANAAAAAPRIPARTSLFLFCMDCIRHGTYRLQVGMEAITRYYCVVVVADAVAFWRALVVTPAPALWHHASPYDINATLNATYDINYSVVLCASRRFLSFLRLSLSQLFPPPRSCSQAPSQTQNTLASSSFPRLAAPIRQFAIAVLLDGGAAPPPSACR
ncbi:hypothetical protein J3E68DRAFT_415034, partial [Trichoderma sp. SZMC 28012]